MIIQPWDLPGSRFKPSPNSSFSRYKYNPAIFQVQDSNFYSTLVSPGIQTTLSKVQYSNLPTTPASPGINKSLRFISFNIQTFSNFTFFLLRIQTWDFRDLSFKPSSNSSFSRYNRIYTLRSSMSRFTSSPNSSFSRYKYNPEICKV